MAWNIDYEHDSEEVILLKKHIAEQGSSIRVVHTVPFVLFILYSFDSHPIVVLDNRYSTLQTQLIKAKNALDDNRATLDETTSRVCYKLICAEVDD